MLGAREIQQRDLPGPPAVRFAVEVEFVLDDDAVVAVCAFAQGDVREDLRSTADDGRIGVDGGIAGHHPDVRRTEQADQVKELFGHQGFERCGVVPGLALSECSEQRGHCDHGLT